MNIYYIPENINISNEKWRGLFPWLFPSSGHANLLTLFRTVRLLGRSQSSTLHVSLARVFHIVLFRQLLIAHSIWVLSISSVGIFLLASSHARNSRRRRRRHHIVHSNRQTRLNAFVEIYHLRLTNTASCRGLKCRRASIITE